MSEDKRNENYQLAMKHKKFIDPDKFDLSFGVKQPVVIYKRELMPGRYNTDIHVDQILHHMLRQLVEELKDNIEYTHYFESVVTGKKYGGYYDYVPASDPICVEVWAGRIKTFNEFSNKIKQLENENIELKASLGLILKPPPSRRERRNNGICK